MPSTLDNLFDNEEENNEENNEKPQDSIAPQSNDNVELSDAQKLIVLKLMQENLEDPPSILEIMEAVWPEKKGTLGWDGRHKDGRIIKNYIVKELNDLNLTPKTKTVYLPKGILTLTTEMQEYVRNNLNLKNTELAAILFEKRFVAPVSQEARTIANYREELRKSGLITKDDNDEEVTKEYAPPKTIDRCCARINKHVDGVDYDYKNLTPTQKKHVFALINYLSNFRFSHHMALIENISDRTLFENTFIRYIYNKPDLSQEDLDQYLMLANESVSESSIKRTIAMLEREQQRIMDSEEKMSMTIVENIKNSREELKACIKTQQSLFKTLDVERSKRMNERIGPQFTLLNFVEAMKNEESRKQLVQEAEKRNDKLKGEIKRLSELDDMIARFWGLDDDIVING